MDKKPPPYRWLNGIVNSDKERLLLLEVLLFNDPHNQDLKKDYDDLQNAIAEKTLLQEGYDFEAEEEND